VVTVVPLVAILATAALQTLLLLSPSRQLVLLKCRINVED
jgi:hypothetical protein